MFWVQNFGLAYVNPVLKCGHYPLGAVLKRIHIRIKNCFPCLFMLKYSHLLIRNIALLTDDAEVLPNIGYLFQAYNLIKGNPLDPRGFDPGFSSLKIFKATYDDEGKTSDGRYKIPDKIDAIASITCSVSATSETMSTELQYKDSLNVKAEASVSGGTAIWQASFSASTEYNRVSDTLKSNSKSVIKSEATCSTYEAAVHSNPAPKFTENFFNNVADLAKNRDYYTFLDRFGTHYVEKIRMGSR